MDMMGRIAVSVVLALGGVPLAAQGGERWTGFYGGLQLGAVDLTGRDRLNGASADGGVAGVHAGYNRDLGDWVLGAELEYDAAGTGRKEDGAAPGEIDTLSRLKVRAGYDMGQTLFYATAGAARADSMLGDETADFYGVGVTYEISSRFVVSGEVLAHDFGVIGGIAGDPIDPDTVSLRFSLRF